MSTPHDPFTDPPKPPAGGTPGPPPPRHQGPGRLPNQGPGYRPYGRSEELPKAQGVLILGIISLVTIGVIGIILASIALSQAKEPMNLIRQFPGRSANEGTVKTGRLLAIISLCISGVMVLFLLFFIIFVLAVEM